MSFARSNPFVLSYSLLHMIGLAHDCRVCFVFSLTVASQAGQTVWPGEGSKVAD
jgi:hypothetical protein